MINYNLKNLKSNIIPLPIGPYNQIIESGNMIFISGQISMNFNTQIIPDNIYDQTYQALQNIKTLLNLKNLKIENIVKITLFTTNMQDIQIINDSYKFFFDTELNKDISKKLPARSCIGVSKLPKGAKIEIEAIAMNLNK